MKPLGLRLATLALALAAGAAFADVGFFRPAADPALTPERPRPPAPAAQPPRPAPPTAAQQAAEMAAAELAATHQADAQRWAEEQMDRSQQEAAQAREEAQRAPPGVGAAFTGSTNERDR